MVISLLERLVNAAIYQIPSAVILTNLLFLWWLFTEYRKVLPFLLNLAEEAGISLKWYNMFSMAIKGFIIATKYPQYIVSMYVVNVIVYAANLPSWVNIPISMVLVIIIFRKPGGPGNGKKKLVNAWKRTKEYLARGIQAPVPSPA